MKNVMDILLGMDESKLESEIKEIDIKRLSSKAGEKVVFTCKGVSVDKYAEIRDNATKGDEVDALELKIFTVIEGVKSPNLKSEELRNRYKAATPKELVKKLLQPGEINKIYEVIAELSGFGDGVIEEIKN